MKIKKIMAFTTAIILGLGMMTGCGKSNSDSNGSDTSAADNSSQTENEEVKPIRDISSWDLVKEMKIGWNLGNTLDANGTSGLAAETSWGNINTSKEMIDFVKKSGFNVLRVPVSWGKQMDENYKIDPDWMARVKEVVDYGIDNGMYVILNTHHEEWYMPDNEHKEKNLEQLKALWTQIADEFKNYDEHLIFEGVNEPRLRNTPKEWTGGDDESREVCNAYAQTFYDTVRNSGGNNAKRHLMITGYAASSMKSCMEAIDLSKFDDKVIVSIHAYLPYSFALDAKGTDKFDENTGGVEIDSMFQNIDDVFLSKKIPVIIGEFGSVNKDNLDDRIACAKYYLKQAKYYGVPCIWWDNGGFGITGDGFGLLDRTFVEWKFPEIVDALIESTK